jgi:protein-S-isoprenylcysteine O-methyltransferase Ste14
VRLARAVLAFLALPGTVAFVVPALLAPVRPWPRLDPIGLGPFLLGVTGLLWCVRSFYVEGKGTLAPWSPPRHLVVTGLYRYSRNPMYVSVVLVLWSWAAAFHSSTHAIYALAVMAAFHLRVVLGEEPWLARTHGEAWRRYRAAVPRWLGVRRG